MADEIGAVQGHPEPDISEQVNYRAQDPATRQVDTRFAPSLVGVVDSRDAQQIARVASDLSGRYGPHRIQFYGSVITGGIRLEGDILHGDQKIGDVSADFFRDPEGNLVAAHGGLEIEREFKSLRGQGFSKALVVELERYYTQSGVDRIELTAGKDGGYAWARRGFTWNSEPVLLKRSLQNIRSAAGRLAKTAVSDDARTILHDIVESLQPDSARLPEPIELADLATAAEPDLGRRLMRGTEWYAAKHLHDSTANNWSAEHDCAHVVAAELSDRYRREFHIDAAPSPRGVPARSLFVAVGAVPRFVTYGEVADMLRELGDGASAVLASRWAGGDRRGGHAYLAVNDGGDIFLIDPEGGRSGWPPYWGEVTRTAAGYLSAAGTPVNRLVDELAELQLIAADSVGKVKGHQVDPDFTRRQADYRAQDPATRTADSRYAEPLDELLADPSPESIRQLAQDLSGFYGPYDVAFAGSVLHGEIVLDGAIRHGSEVIGRVIRRYNRGARADIVAHHDSLVIAEHHRGKGFAKALTAELERYYVHSGVARIVLDAEGAGAYVWARRGFGWNMDGDSLRCSLSNIRDSAQQLAPRVNDAARAVLTDLEKRLRVHHAELPEPIDLAALSAPGEPDLGQRLLRGSTVFLVRHLPAGALGEKPGVVARVRRWLGGAADSRTGCAQRVLEQLSARYVREFRIEMARSPRGIPAWALFAAIGSRAEFTTYFEVQQRLLQLGDGASAVLASRWSGGRQGGHAYLAVNDGGALFLIDGRTGERSGWPPHWGQNAVDVTAVGYLDANGEPLRPQGDSPSHVALAAADAVGDVQGNLDDNLRAVADAALRQRFPMLDATSAAAELRHPLGLVELSRSRAQANAVWWAELSDAAIDALIQTYPGSIGNADGIPATARDKANRQALAADQHRRPAPTEDSEMLTRVQQVAQEFAAAESRAKENRVDVYLLAYDPLVSGDDVRVLVSFGNPDMAQEVTWHVPAIQRPAVIAFAPAMQAALTDLWSNRRRNPTLPVAAIAWIGHRVPSSFAEADNDTVAYAAGVVLHGDVAAFSAARDAGRGSANQVASNVVAGYGNGALIIGNAWDSGLTNHIRIARLYKSPEAAFRLFGSAAPKLSYRSEARRVVEIPVATDAARATYRAQDIAHRRIEPVLLPRLSDILAAREADGSPDSRAGDQLAEDLSGRYGSLSVRFGFADLHESSLLLDAALQNHEGDSVGDIQILVKRDRDGGLVVYHHLLLRRPEFRWDVGVLLADLDRYYRMSEVSTVWDGGIGPIDAAPEDFSIAEVRHGAYGGCAHRAAAELSERYGREFVVPTASSPTGVPARTLFEAVRSEAKFATFVEIENQLLRAGSGASAVVVSSWANVQGGHAYLAINDGGTIYLVGPGGRRSPWPPSWRLQVALTAVGYLDGQGNPTDPLTPGSLRLAAADAIGDVQGRRAEREFFLKQDAYRAPKDRKTRVVDTRFAVPLREVVENPDQDQLRQLAEDLSGVYGLYRVAFESSEIAGSVYLRGDILFGDDRIGTVQRRFSYDRDGRLVARHIGLEVTPAFAELRGKGFAKVLTAELERYYVRSGVDRILLVSENQGTYAWSRRGFTWATEHLLSSFNSIKNSASALLALRGPNRLSDEGRDVLSSVLERLDPGSSEPPEPIDLANLATPAEPDLGQRLLSETSVYFIRHLPRPVPNEVAAHPRSDCAHRVVEELAARYDREISLKSAHSAHGTPAWALYEALGTQAEFASYSEAGQCLLDLGDGSSAVLASRWSEGRQGGHAYLAVNDGGALFLIDGRTGERSGWPPYWGEDAVSHIAVGYLDAAGQPMRPLGDVPLQLALRAADIVGDVQGTPEENVRAVADAALARRVAGLPPARALADIATPVRDLEVARARARDNAAWWAQLSGKEKLALFRSYPRTIGRAEGIPTADRDQVNRTLLFADRARLWTVLDSGGALSTSEREALAELDKFHDALSRATRQGGENVYLLSYERDRTGVVHAVVAFGDPYAAAEVAWHVAPMHDPMAALLDPATHSPTDFQNPTPMAVIAWIRTGPAGIGTAHDAGAVLDRDVVAFNAGRGAAAGDIEFTNNVIVGHGDGSTIVANAWQAGLDSRVHEIRLVGADAAVRDLFGVSAHPTDGDVIEFIVRPKHAVPQDNVRVPQTSDVEQEDRGDDLRRVAEEALARRTPGQRPALAGTELISPWGQTELACARARANARWWADLTDHQRVAVMETYPRSIGNAEGIPAEIRDQLNRMSLDRDSGGDVLRLQAKRDRGESLTAAEQVVVALEAVDLRARQIKVNTYLLAYDPHESGRDARVMVSFADADTAEEVSWHVPAMRQPMVASLDAAMAEALRYVNSAPGDEPVASVAWIGYRTANAGLPDAHDLADVAGAVLTSDIAAFASGRNALSGSRSPHNVVVGYGGGALVLGHAWRNGLPAHIDRVRLIDAPDRAFSLFGGAASQWNQIPGHARVVEIPVDGDVGRATYRIQDVSQRRIDPRFADRLDVVLSARRADGSVDPAVAFQLATDLSGRCGKNGLWSARFVLADLTPSSLRLTSTVWSAGSGEVGGLRILVERSQGGAPAVYHELVGFESHTDRDAYAALLDVLDRYYRLSAVPMVSDIAQRQPMSGGDVVDQELAIVRAESSFAGDLDGVHPAGENCALRVAELVSDRYGRKFVVGALPSAAGVPARALFEAVGSDAQFATFGDVEAELRSLGRGASAVLASSWVNGKFGHAYLAVNDGGRVRLIGPDGQASPWPPAWRLQVGLTAVGYLNADGEAVNPVPNSSLRLAPADAIGLVKGHPGGGELTDAVSRLADAGLTRRGIAAAEALRNPLDVAEVAVARARDNAAWWAGLSHAEKLALVETYPQQIGNSEGIPATDRDKANRITLQKGEESFGDGDEVAAARFALVAHSLAEAELAAQRAGLAMYLLAFDPAEFGGDGRVAVAFGADPYTADSVVWHVGVSVSMHSDELLGAGMHLALSYLVERQVSDPTTAVTSTAWIGHDGDRADTPNLARIVGGRLYSAITAFNAGRDASTTNGSSFNSNDIFGYGYGTAVLRAAAEEGRLSEHIHSLGRLDRPTRTADIRFAHPLNEVLDKVQTHRSSEVMRQTEDDLSGRYGPFSVDIKASVIDAETFEAHYLDLSERSAAWPADQVLSLRGSVTSEDGRRAGEFVRLVFYSVDGSLVVHHWHMYLAPWAQQQGFISALYDLWEPYYDRSGVNRVELCARAANDLANRGYVLDPLMLDASVDSLLGQIARMAGDESTSPAAIEALMSLTDTLYGVDIPTIQDVAQLGTEDTPDLGATLLAATELFLVRSPVEQTPNVPEDPVRSRFPDLLPWQDATDRIHELINPIGHVELAQERARANAAWWAALEPHQQQTLITLHSWVIGNSEGVSAEHRNDANLWSLQRDLLESEQVDDARDRSGGPNALQSFVLELHRVTIRAALARVHVYLLAYPSQNTPEPGRFVVGFGSAPDPFAVASLTWHVGAGDAALSNQQSTSVLQRALDHVLESIQDEPTTSVASIAWIGFSAQHGAESPDITGAILHSDIAAFIAGRGALAESQGQATQPFVSRVVVDNGDVAVAVAYAMRSGLDAHVRDVTLFDYGGDAPARIAGDGKLTQQPSNSGRDVVDEVSTINASELSFATDPNRMHPEGENCAVRVADLLSDRYEREFEIRAVTAAQGVAARTLFEEVGSDARFASFKEIEDTLLGLGHGSSAVVVSSWREGEFGHAYLTVNDGGRVYLIDSDGQRLPWPPRWRSQVALTAVGYLSVDGDAVNPLPTSSLRLAPADAVGDVRGHSDRSADVVRRRAAYRTQDRTTRSVDTTFADSLAKVLDSLDEEQVRQFADDLSGFYGPYRVGFNGVLFSSTARVYLDGNIFDGEEQIGTVRRWFGRDERGRLVAHHTGLKINDDYQHLRGKGFATALTTELERYYVSSGVDRIELTAHESGTYTWARQGFTWSSNPVGLQQALARVRHSASRLAAVVDAEASAVLAEIAQRLEPGHSLRPEPMEIASLATSDMPDLGRRLLEGVTAELMKKLPFERTGAEHYLRRQQEYRGGDRATRPADPRYADPVGDVVDALDSRQVNRLAEDLSGKYGPYALDLTARVEAFLGKVRVEGEIMSGDGLIGTVNFSHFRDADNLVVSFDLVDIHDLHSDLRGNGFAKALASQLFPYYTRSGVDRIEVEATRDGAYAWASWGFTWDPDHARMRESFESILLSANELRGNLGLQERLLLDNIVARLQVGHPQMPEPIELARLSTASHPHLGMELMLDTAWHGVMYLDGTDTAQAAVSPDAEFQLPFERSGDATATADTSCAHGVAAELSTRYHRTFAVASVPTAAGVPARALFEAVGSWAQFTTYDEVTNALRRLGDGASAVLASRWSGSRGGGHAYLAINDGGELFLIDPATRKRSGWPPSWGKNAVSRTVVGYLDADGHALRPIKVEVPFFLGAADAIGNVTGGPEEPAYQHRQHDYRNRDRAIDMVDARYADPVDDVVNRVRPDVIDQLANDLSGSYGGFRIHLEGFDVDGHRLVLGGEIIVRSQPVGTVSWSFDRDADGNLTAHHVLRVDDESFPGDAFADAVASQLVPYYTRSGISRVVSTTRGTTGYVSAELGDTWDPTPTRLRESLGNLRQAAAELRTGLDDEAARVLDEIVQLLQPTNQRLPEPADIALIATSDAPSLGRQLLDLAGSVGDGSGLHYVQYLWSTRLHPSQNCANWVAELLSSRYDIEIPLDSAPSAEGVPAKALFEAVGSRAEFATYAEVEAMLWQMNPGDPDGPGPAALLVSSWPGGTHQGGHAYLAVMDDGQIYLMDPLTGERSGWPPYWGDDGVSRTAVGYLRANGRPVLPFDGSPEQLAAAEAIGNVQGAPKYSEYLELQAEYRATDPVVREVDSRYADPANEVVDNLDPQQARQLADDLSGMYGPYRVELTAEVARGSGEILMSGRILHDARVIGRITWVLGRDLDDGLLVAYHDVIEINETDLQGKGFATALASQLQPYYERSNVDRVEADARWDGAYVWARWGFTWSPDPDKLQDSLDSLKTSAETIQNDPSTDVDTNELVERILSWLTPNHPLLLQPFELARLGTRGRPSLGSDLLMDTEWHGVKYLSDRTTPLRDRADETSVLPHVGKAGSHAGDADSRRRQEDYRAKDPTTRPVETNLADPLGDVVDSRDEHQVRALARDLSGMYGPYRVDFNWTLLLELGDTVRLLINGDIRDGTRLAGRVQRTFVRDGDGNLVAHHESLWLRDEFKQQGFARAFLSRQREYYERSGVDRIVLTAGDDDGGYVWARLGLTWNPDPALLQSSLQKIKGSVRDLRSSVSSEARALLGDVMQRLDASHPRLPEPVELAHLATDAEPDLGARLLRGADWHAAMFLGNDLPTAKPGAPNCAQSVVDALSDRYGRSFDISAAPSHKGVPARALFEAVGSIPRFVSYAEVASTLRAMPSGSSALLASRWAGLDRGGHAYLAVNDGGEIFLIDEAGQRSGWPPHWGQDAVSRTVVGYLNADGRPVRPTNADVSPQLQFGAADAIGTVHGHPDGANFARAQRGYRHQDPGRRRVNTDFADPLGHVVDSLDPRKIRQLALDLSGVYGPYRVQMISARVGPVDGVGVDDAVLLSGDIVYAGRAIGEIERAYFHDDGDLVAYHRAVKIFASAFQGKGFSTALAQELERYYSRCGVDRIVLAAVSDGAYVWAKSGYTWDPNPISLELSCEFIRDAVERLRDSVGPDARAVLDEVVTRLDPTHPRMPEPDELARLTAPGHPDLGKKLLRGTPWFGAKYLTHIGGQQEVGHGETNCAHRVATLLSNNYGRNISVATKPTAAGLPARALFEAVGSRVRFATYEEVANTLRSMPSGSAAVLASRWAGWGRGGHAYLAVNVGGEIFLVDETGHRSGWPPYWGQDAVSRTVAGYVDADGVPVRPIEVDVPIRLQLTPADAIGNVKGHSGDSADARRARIVEAADALRQRGIARPDALVNVPRNNRQLKRRREQANATWWRRLSQSQQDALIEIYPWHVANTQGLPRAARDRAHERSMGNPSVGMPAPVDGRQVEATPEPKDVRIIEGTGDGPVSMVIAHPDQVADWDRLADASHRELSLDGYIDRLMLDAQLTVREMVARLHRELNKHCGTPAEVTGMDDKHLRIYPEQSGEQYIHAMALVTDPGTTLEIAYQSYQMLNESKLDAHQSHISYLGELPAGMTAAEANAVAFARWARGELTNDIPPAQLTRELLDLHAQPLRSALLIRARLISDYGVEPHRIRIVYAGEHRHSGKAMSRWLRAHLFTLNHIRDSPIETRGAIVKALLGDGKTAEERSARVGSVLDRFIAAHESTGGPKRYTLLWVRDTRPFGQRGPELDTNPGHVRQILDMLRARQPERQVLLVGDDLFAGRPELRESWRREGVLDTVDTDTLIKFWERDSLTRAEQALFFHRLGQLRDVVQIGQESGALETQIVLGMPTVYLSAREYTGNKADRWLHYSQPWQYGRTVPMLDEQDNPVFDGSGWPQMEFRKLGDPLPAPLSSVERVPVGPELTDPMNRDVRAGTVHWPATVSLTASRISSLIDTGKMDQWADQLGRTVGLNNEDQTVWTEQDWQSSQVHAHALSRSLHTQAATPEAIAHKWDRIRLALQGVVAPAYTNDESFEGVSGSHLNAVHGTEDVLTVRGEHLIAEAYSADPSVRPRAVVGALKQIFDAADLRGQALNDLCAFKLTPAELQHLHEAIERVVAANESSRALPSTETPLAALNPAENATDTTQRHMRRPGAHTADAGRHSIKDPYDTLGTEVVPNILSPRGSDDHPVFFGPDDLTAAAEYGSAMTEQDVNRWSDRDAAKALQAYTGLHAHKVVNEWLRERDPGVEQPMLIGLLDKAFLESSAFAEPVLLTRGATARDFNGSDLKFSPSDSLDRLKALESTTYVFDGYMSTSLSTIPAWVRFNPVRVIISMKPGQRGIYVGGAPDGPSLSQRRGEREVILPRGQTLRVLKVRKSLAAEFEVDVLVEVVVQPHHVQELPSVDIPFRLPDGSNDQNAPSTVTGETSSAADESGLSAPTRTDQGDVDVAEPASSRAGERWDATADSPQRPQPVRANPVSTEFRRLGQSVVSDIDAPVGTEVNPHYFGADSTDSKTFGCWMTPQDDTLLDAQQLLAIKRFTGQTGYQINAWLRHGDGDEPADVALLDAAMSAQEPIGVHVVVVRGTTAMEFNANSRQIQFSHNATVEQLRSLVGATYVSQGFPSMSLATVPLFPKRVRLILTMKPGQRCIYVDGAPSGDRLSGSPYEEREVILPRGQTFRVVEVRESTADDPRSRIEVDVIVEVSSPTDSALGSYDEIPNQSTSHGMFDQSGKYTAMSPEHMPNEPVPLSAPTALEIKSNPHYTPMRVNPAGTEYKRLGRIVVPDRRGRVGSEGNPHYFRADDTADWQAFGSSMTPQHESHWDSRQLASIRAYTGKESKGFNAWLHYGVGDGPAGLEDLDAAMRTSRFAEFTVVTRATTALEFNENSLGSEFSRTHIKDLKRLEGATYVSRAFTSASLSTMPGYPGRVRVIYTMMPGQRGIYVGGAPDGNRLSSSGFAHVEREVILPRGQTLLVLKVRKSTDSRNFLADVIVKVVDQPV
ncbi:toxin glutamine deamidase domain-containing protein [Mycobacterium sp. LTG2003]